MKLTQAALQRITDSRTIPAKLKEVLGISRITLWRYLKENDDALTKAAALKVIREETGLPESEILDECEKVRA